MLVYKRLQRRTHTTHLSDNNTLHTLTIGTVIYYVGTAKEELLDRK